MNHPIHAIVEVGKTSVLIQLELYLHDSWHVERKYPKSMQCDQQLLLLLYLPTVAIGLGTTRHRKSLYLLQFAQLLAATH